MKRTGFKRKASWKGFKPRKTKMSTEKKARTDPGQREVPSIKHCQSVFNEAMIAHWKAANKFLCARCNLGESGQYPLEVSHFFNVRKSGTRFEPMNVDPLHRICHTGPNGWEYQKGPNGAYEAYMLIKLGRVHFEALRLLSMEHISLEQAKITLLHKLEHKTLHEVLF